MVNPNSGSRAVSIRRPSKNRLTKYANDLHRLGRSLCLAFFMTLVEPFRPQQSPFPAIVHDVQRRFLRRNLTQEIHRDEFSGPASQTTSDGSVFAMESPLHVGKDLPTRLISGR